MKITIRVKPNARKNEVEKIAENQFVVSVTARPVEGRANERVIEVLAEYFRKPKRNFSIVRGKARRDKTIEIL